MKKLFTLLLCVSFLVSNAKVEIGIGAKAGLSAGKWTNISKSAIVGSRGGTVSVVPGINAGLVFDMNLNKFVGIRIGADFTQKGTQIKQTGGTIVNTYRYNSNSVEIPLTVKVGYATPNLNIHLNAGGFFGYVFSGKESLKQTNNNSLVVDNSNKAVFDDNNFQKIDFGVLGGVGLEVKTGKNKKSKIIFDINYLNGFNAVNKQSSNYKPYSGNFQITAGYIYTIKGNTTTTTKENSKTTSTKKK